MECDTDDGRSAVGTAEARFYDSMIQILWFYELLYPDGGKHAAKELENKPAEGLEM